MMTFRLRSACISSFSVSIPLSSGMRTSKIIKSGRSPPFTFAIASLPELTVSTSYPSTSRSVCKYFRMLGSSSTTRIFSLAAIEFSLYPSAVLQKLSLIHGQQKCEFASYFRLALDPDLPAMRLNKALRYRESETHPRSVAVHAHEIFKNLLMMLRRNPRSRVRHGNFHTIRPRQPESPPFFDWRHCRHAPLPEMRPGFQGHASARWRMFQRIVQKIRGRLLYFLVVEPERRNRWIEARIQLHPFALKSLRPPLRQLIQTIAKIILSKLQHQFSAL